MLRQNNAPEEEKDNEDPGLRVSNPKGPRTQIMGF